MKRLITVILSAVLLFCGCSATNNNYSITTDKINIITTIFPQYDFAQQIGKDKINLNMLIPPGSESHTYEPTPKDMINIRDCDIFIYTGGESDEWVRDIISGIDTDTIFISLMDIVKPLEQQQKEGMQNTHLHENHHDHKEYDEHIWTSPVNAMKICEYIYNILCENDKNNAEFYKNNYIEYINELKQLDNSINEIISTAKRNTIVFGDRFPIRYFTEQYNIEYFAAFPGCAEQVEPSPKTLIYLINKVRDENIPVVFYREFSNKKVASIICEETGAKMLEFHSGHSITSDEFYSGITYIDIMKSNIENLREALN